MTFEEPKMEILTFAKNDLVVASNPCTGECDNVGCLNVCTFFQGCSYVDCPDNCYEKI